jgi:predicted ATPase
MRDIPNNLLRENHGQYDVNIIIGENGSGKSQVLDKIGKICTQRKINTIAISTSVHDKFDNQSRYFHFYGGRHGRNMVSKIIKKSISYEGKSEIRKGEILEKVFEFVGFEPEISFKFSDFNPSSLIDIDTDKISERDLHFINSLENLNDNRDEPYWTIYFTGDIFNSNKIRGIEAVIRNERILKKAGVISKITLAIRKPPSPEYIKLESASSGELMMLSTLIFISSVIESGTTILIDEPENSFHPRWQREYIEKILDLFYLYRPKLIIATHSPMIIPTNNLMINLYKAKHFKLQEVLQKSNNNEEVLADVFGVITPENRYLSNHLIELLNKFEDGNISKEEINTCIDKLSSMIKDERQVTLLHGTKNLVKEIEIALQTENLE